MILFLPIALLIPCKTYATYNTLPPEKRLQICCELHNALNPSKSHYQPYWWIASKIIIASLVAASTTYTAAKLDTRQEAKPEQNTNRNNLLKIQTAIHRLRKNLGTNPSPITTAFAIPNHLAQGQMSLTKGQFFMFVASTAASYLIVSLFFDNKIISHRTVLKEFLINWPDYSIHAPENLCTEARSLYASYLHQGDSVIADEKTAELIILAFTVFLRVEIEAITRSL
jgi:hypothetical protein